MGGDMSKINKEENDGTLYFVRDKSEKVGPFTLHELREEWKEGGISSEATYAGKELNQEWFDRMFHEKLMTPMPQKGIGESVLLLRQIEENTANTHFWVRVCGIPVLLGIIIWVISAIATIK